MMYYHIKVLLRIKKIKKAIKSIELPMVEFPTDTMKQIFDKIVIVDQEKLCLCN